MTDFKQRLKSLKGRRQGLSASRTLEEASFLGLESFPDMVTESYEKLSETESIKYAIGAMERVDEESTDISIREGNRVADTLIDSLKISGISTIKRMQGSVALDIHIEGHSDVDMLIILEGPLLVEEPVRDMSRYRTYTGSSVEDAVKELRLESENILRSLYHQADVDDSNNKSIALEGGSLQRKIDIVPSCWFDSCVL